MIKRTTLFVPIVALAFALSVIVVPQVVRAEEEDTAQTVAAEDTNERSEKLKQLRDAAAQKRQAALEKLQAQRQLMSDAQKEREAKRNENFKKACQNRHEAYKKRLANVKVRVERHIDTLDKIVLRVDTFVTDKNLTVPDYAALLADAKAKGELVDSVHAALKEKAEAFDCGNSPDEAKAALADFKDAFKQELDALHDYKMAVKDLIKAVKTVANPKQGDSDESN